MALTPKLLQQGSGGGPKNYIEEVFSTFLYTGNGATQTITNGIDLSTKGGLTWFKKRNGATASALFDSARGAQNWLSSSSTGSQTSAGIDAWVQNTNGFSLGNGGGGWNGDLDTYVSWTFRKQPKFFDIVTYTGTGSNITIAHSLGSVPACIIVKRTDTTGAWQVYHRSLANTEYLVLNTTAAKATGATRWNSTTPTSSVFSLGTDATVNASAGTYVAYIFAHDAGGFGLTGTDNVISCGSYTGNGAAGGQLINLGYEAQWVMIKNVAAGHGWWMVDIMRGYQNSTSDFGGDNSIDANGSAGDANQVIGHPSAQGFTAVQDNVNESGQTYIYMAIRRGPMKVPTVGTSVFASTGHNGTGATNDSVTFDPVPYIDLTWIKSRNTASTLWAWTDRLRGATKELDSSTTTTETTYANDVTGLDYMSASGQSIRLGSGASGNVNTSTYTYSDIGFRRAPGFFDEVCYTGTGSANRQITHNLTVAPELIICKARNSGLQEWRVLSTALGQVSKLNGTNAFSTTNLALYFGDDTSYVAPTSGVFTVGSAGDTNGNTITYVAYLFATCAGVSKVGSYTGTATTKQVNCGFTAGARFVLIKRTDSTGDWYVWDTARGIISGNDPYLLMNSTADEVTNTDYIDSYSPGFELSSTAPAAINANGGTYIFLAIA